MGKRVNKCISWDEHWGCAISPMKKCNGCANADWRIEGEDKSNQHTLEVGEYFIPDDCTAKFVGRTVVVYKRKSKKLAPTEHRCKDCKHRVKGHTFRQPHYETMVCELKPKEENGLFYCAPLYGKPCENFEKK